MNPLRILHVVTTMDYGGVETLLMSIYRNIDKEKIQFDFLCHNRIEAKFTNEISALGGKMYMVHGPGHGGLVNYWRELKRFFEEHSEYKIIHCHINSDSGACLWYAKQAGISVRIAHSHVAFPKKKLARRIYSKVSSLVVNKSLTVGMACSQDAGISLFGRKASFIVIPNAITVNNFRFNAKERDRIRKEFKVEKDETLIAHVGRFSKEKNHQFIIKVFSAFCKQHSQARLLLIGAGELEREVRELVSAENIDDKVIFAGQFEGMGPYYSAMDLFLFPSIYEGLGIVAVEAQCSGLPVIASDHVPIEAKVTDQVEFLSLEDSISVWCEHMEKALLEDNREREKYYNVVKESKYNIQKTTSFLQQFYENAVEN